MRYLPVFDSDSTNIGPIAHLKAARELAAKTPQYTYLLCHDTIRTQILFWSKSCEFEMPGFWR